MSVSRFPELEPETKKYQAVHHHYPIQTVPLHGQLTVLLLVVGLAFLEPSAFSTDRDFLMLKMDLLEELCFDTVASMESNALAIRRTDGCPPLASSSRRILCNMLVPETINDDAEQL